MATVNETVPAKRVGTVITEEDYNTLLGMLKSSDPGDHVVARSILNKCDVQKSIYWIWKLSRNHYTITGRMIYLRTKDSRIFNDLLDGLFDLSYKNEENFADFLLNKNWMTTEIFQYLKAGIIDLVKNQCNNTFFDLKFSIKPEYLQYDPDNKLEDL